MSLCGRNLHHPEFKTLYRIEHFLETLGYRFGKINRFQRSAESVTSTFSANRLDLPTCNPFPLYYISTLLHLTQSFAILQTAFPCGPSMNFGPPETEKKMSTISGFRKWIAAKQDFITKHTRKNWSPV